MTENRFIFGFGVRGVIWRSGAFASPALAAMVLRLQTETRVAVGTALPSGAGRSD